MGRTFDPIYLPEFLTEGTERATLDHQDFCSIDFPVKAPLPQQVMPTEYIKGDTLELHFTEDGRDVIRNVVVRAKQNNRDGTVTLIFQSVPPEKKPRKRK